MFRETIEHRIADAMKTGNKTELAVWRAIKNEFLIYKTAKAENELTDAVELKLIQKLVSQRKDSFEQYSAAGRNDLAETEKSELDILKGLLPKDPTEPEIKEEIEKAVNELDHAPEMKDMKTIQSVVRSKFPTVNGGVVAKLFKDLISKSITPT